MESVADLIEKAKIEESAYNWSKAADLYEEIAKFKLERNQKEEAAEIFKKIGKLNTLVADTSDISEDYVRYNRKAINSYEKALNLFEGLENEAEELECQAEIEYINGCLSQNTEEAKSFSKNSYDLFKKSNRIFAINSNQEGILRTHSRAIAAVSIYNMIISEKREIERIFYENIKINQEILELSKKLKNFKYSAEYFYHFNLIYYSTFFIFSFKHEKKLIQVAELYCNLCLELLRAVKDVDDSYIQGLVRHAAGTTLCFIGFQFGKDDVDQQEKLKKGIELLISSLKIAEEINLKHLIISSIYWLNWWAVSAGRIEIIQDRVLEYLKKITDSAKLYENTFSISHYYAKLLPAFIYTNLSFRKFFSKRTRISHAKRSINFAKKGIDLFSPFPCSSWFYQMLIWSHGNLALLSKNRDERDNYSEIMMDYAKTFDKIAEQYEGGFVKAVQYSGLYIAYKTRADLTEDKNEKIKMLSAAAAEQKKYMAHAVESRAGIVISYIRLGLLFEEIGILSGENDHLNSAKAVFSEAANESIQKGYYSYAAVAFEHNARMEDRLGNHSFAAENYKKAQRFYLETLRDIGFEPLIIKINEKINYTQAWNLIEIAKSHHKQEDHVNAKNNYVKAYEILKELPNYKYEAPYYYAWTLQEEAELFSKNEKHEEAIELYKLTIDNFKKAIDEFQKDSIRLREKTKKEKIDILEKVANLRIEYCNARINIEEARILSKKGEHLAAAEKFAVASSKFRYVCSIYNIREERIELEAVYNLCRAWESMELAENFEDPDRYAEAANLFTKASELFPLNKMKLFASGNSAFCQALEIGCRFDETLEIQTKEELYPKIKIMLRKASSLYQKGGYNNVADWALATSTYFDASWHLIKADGETNLEEKNKLLIIGSEVLKSASELFDNAGYHYTKSEINNKLELIQKEEKILISALNMLREPSISRSTIGIHAPSCPIESSLSPRLSELSEITAESQKMRDTEKKIDLKKMKAVSTESGSLLDITQEETKELEKIESEMDIKIQKIICIVHKGTIDGTVYICPKCKTYYCLTCAYSLKAKGERCWSCENEINP